MAKKREGSITKTKDMTTSDSHTRSSKAPRSIEEILGTTDAPPVDNDRFLLKLKSAKRLEKILSQLNVESALAAHDKIATVLGPFSKSQIIALCEAKLITKRDELLVPQSTWKLVSDVLTEIRFETLVSEEHTSTLTMTESITETASSQAEPVPLEPSPAPASAVQKGEATETIVRPIARDLKPSRPRPQLQNMDTFPAYRKSIVPTGLWAWLAFAGIIVGIVSVWKFGPFGKLQPKGSGSGATATGMASDEWPEYLKARDYDDLKVNRSPLLAKLDPVLEVYEKGGKVISEPDMKLLRVLAGPGSASLEARILASNLLAALALSKGQTEESRKILEKLIEIAGTDPTTLLNRSLTFFVAHEYRDARDVASQALRLCRGQSCWVARAMLGLIAAEEERWGEVDENFKAAAEISRGNLFVMGLWLRALRGASKETAKSKSTTLLTETLVLDPDVTVDSPLRAPLATQVFLTEVLRGFRSGLAIAPDALTEGQKKYIEWLLSRLDLNPLSTSSTEALETLRGEPAALSQLAESYLEKDAGHLDRAAEILTRTLTRLSGTSIKSSWPWSFAGDIQRVRGLYDQAIIFYERALSRNPRDVNAVFGQALIYREKKDYKLSYQGIEESVSLDPDYMPAQLRRDRFEWEKYWLSK